MQRALDRRSTDDTVADVEDGDLSRRDGSHRLDEANDDGAVDPLDASGRPLVPRSNLNHRVEREYYVGRERPVAIGQYGAQPVDFVLEPNDDG
jgi:hypothetical protein